MSDTEALIETLAAHRVRLFQLAGILMVATAALFAGEVALDREFELWLGMVAPAGFTAAFLGAVGLAPMLRERAPMAATAGIIMFAIGVLGGVVLVVGSLAELAGLIDARPAWVDAANLPLLIGGILLGFGTYGVAAIRTGALPGFVGWLLLWPAVVFGGLIIVVATFVLGLELPHTIHVGHSVTEILVYLGIAQQLRRSAGPAGHRSAVDSTA